MEILGDKWKKLNLPKLINALGVANIWVALNRDSEEPFYYNKARS